MAAVRVQLLCGQTQRRSTDIGSEQNRCPFPPHCYPCEYTGIRELNEWTQSFIPFYYTFNTYKVCNNSTTFTCF